MDTDENASVAERTDDSVARLVMSSSAREEELVQLLPPGHAAYGKVYKLVLETAASRKGGEAAVDDNDSRAGEAVALPPPPVLGERVAIYYRAYVAAKDTDLKREPDAQGRVLFDSSDEGVTDAAVPFSFVLGRHQVIPVVELALFTMRTGEKALVRCLTPKYAYDSRGRRAKRGQWAVKPNCDSIELEITFLGTMRLVNGVMQLVSADGAQPYASTTQQGASATGNINNTTSIGTVVTPMASMTTEEGPGEAGTPRMTQTTAGAGNVAAPPLLRYRKTRAFADLKTDAERLAYALEAKELGNYYFKGGQLEAATQEYEVALQTLQLWGKRPLARAHVEEDAKTDATADLHVEGEREQLTRTLLNNLARAHYRRGAYHDAVRLADLVLESLKQANEGKQPAGAEDPMAADAAATMGETIAAAAHPLMVKAHFTRGQAHRQLGNYEEAKRDLLQVTRLEPKHIAAKKELEQLQQLIETHRRQEKRAFGGIFSNAARRAPLVGRVTHAKNT